MIGIKDTITLAAEEAEFTRRWGQLFEEDSEDGDSESWESFCERELRWIDRLP